MKNKQYCYFYGKRDEWDKLLNYILPNSGYVHTYHINAFIVQQLDIVNISVLHKYL